jgi:excisionase family DNA binding protein
MSDELCTVREAAQTLGVHMKTVLRFIREGRLPAHRMGKSYRIQRSDVAIFAGLPAASIAVVGEATAKPSITAIVDIPGVAAPLAQRWMIMVTASLKSRSADSGRLDVQVIHDYSGAQLKIIVVGDSGEVLLFLSLVHVWINQLRA